MYNYRYTYAATAMQILGSKATVEPSPESLQKALLEASAAFACLDRTTGSAVVVLAPAEWSL
jgi:hypothetical protein